MYKIEKGVPHVHGRRHSSGYPFSEMEVSDSFRLGSEKEMLAAAHAARYFSARHLPGSKFSQSKMVENGVPVYRIFRVK